MSPSGSPETLDSTVYTCFFPEEVVTEILLSIPSKYLIKLKTVCKPWNLIISKPDFIISHCARSQAQRQELFIPICNSSEGHLSIKIPSLSVQTENIIFTSLSRRLRSNVTFRGSCNGLLLLGNPISVCNPATGQFQLLPDPILYQSDLTLVHDISTDKYKVFAIASSACLMVLTLDGDGSKEDWRDVGNVGYSESPFVCIGNELHLVGFSHQYEDGNLVSKGSYVYSVDIGKEKIRKTKIPTKEKIIRKNKRLSDMKGSLCLTTMLADSLEIRILENESWTEPYIYRIQLSSNVPNFLEKFTNHGNDICIVGMPCGDGSDLVEAVRVFMHVEDKVVVYDLKKNVLQKIGYLDEFLTISRLYVFYFDSLVRW